MAKLEIPSIVVHAGSCSCPTSPQMERAARSLQRSLSKQEQVDPEGAQEGEEGCDQKSQDISNSDVPPRAPSPPIKQQQLQPGEPPTEPLTIVASPALPRPKSQNSKVKLLVRSHAMREETSPPPDPERATLEPPTNSATPLGPRPSSRLRLKHQGSSQGSLDSSSPLSLSRDSSTEQPPGTGDSSGVDLPTFLIDTVNRSMKDRQLLLRIEQDLLTLVRDPKRSQFKFPPMSSYQRMLVHRMAALYNMEHNVDTSGAQVLVARTPGTRAPDLRLRDQVRGELETEPRRSILKRDTNSLEDTGFKVNADSRRSKSFEEREEEYEKVRKRIFKQDGEGVVRGDSGLGEDDEVRGGTWGVGHVWSSTDSSDTGGQRPQLLRPSPPHSTSLRPSRLLKVESFESRDHLRANSLRQAVSKSYSFGGYSGGAAAPSLARGDSLISTHSAGARLLTKQDSGGSSIASRLSPLSSGYKSLGSQRSDATLSATPSPTATPMLPQGPLQPQAPAPTLVWAVTSMDSVPAGSVLINPQTGQPYLNSDGSLYRFDPCNPPRLVPAPDPPPVHSAPQPPSIQVHSSYTCAPAPPPPAEYHSAPVPALHGGEYHPQQHVPPQGTEYPQQQQQQPTHMVYTYTAHQQHTHQSCHPQEGCMGAVSELATFLAGLQVGGGGEAGGGYVVAPGWSPQQQGPRPPLLPQPASPQQPAVMVSGQQPAVLLVPPQRPMALFAHSGSEGYYSTPVLPPHSSSSTPGSGYPAQHALSPSTPLIRSAGTSEGVTFPNPGSSTFFPGAAGCPSSVGPFPFTPAGQVVGSSSSSHNSRSSSSRGVNVVDWCSGQSSRIQQNNLPPQNMAGPNSLGPHSDPWQLIPPGGQQQHWTGTPHTHLWPSSEHSQGVGHRSRGSVVRRHNQRERDQRVV